MPQGGERSQAKPRIHQESSSMRPRHSTKRVPITCFRHSEVSAGRRRPPQAQTPPLAILMANEGVLGSRVPGQGHGCLP